MVAVVVVVEEVDGNRENETLRGECGGEEAVEGERDVDDVDGGEEGDPLLAEDAEAVFVIWAMGTGSGAGISSSLPILAAAGETELRHISRIEARSPTCLVRWGTRVSARLARSPCNVVALYACGSGRVVEAYA